MASYFELHDARSLDEARRADMAAIAAGPKGYDPELDLKLDRILRMLARAAAP